MFVMGKGMEEFENKKKITRDLLGKRILVQNKKNFYSKNTEDVILEYKVMEFSDSGYLVKLLRKDGNKEYWVYTSEYIVIDTVIELPEII